LPGLLSFRVYGEFRFRVQGEFRFTCFRGLLTVLGPVDEYVTTNWTLTKSQSHNCCSPGHLSVAIYNTFACVFSIYKHYSYTLYYFYYLYFHGS
jgi:hypothetical protein